MNLRLSIAILSACLATPAMAEETSAPTTLTNLSAAPKVPVQFAAPAEIVQVVATPTTAPDDDHATLAAAVAAQSAVIDDEELNCLAIGVYYESKGEPLAGQLAVADVILNRMTSGRFPTSACGVLTQRGQFSFVKGGRLPDVDASRPAWKTAVAIARIARQDLWESPAKGALFFHARRVSPNWGKTRVASLGNHIFYR